MRYKRRRIHPREWLLPAPERRAARMERAVEEQFRRERDWYCERSRQLARIEAERRKWSAFVPY
jgi:hypothetical protein